MRQYGFLGIPDDLFRKATQAMQDEDTAAGEAFEYLPDYERLLDAALNAMWPGTEPAKVTSFEVRDRR